MNDNETFELRPSAVNKWLDGLPLASVGETARQIYLALRTVNRLDDASAKDIYHFLERIAEPLALILPELHRHYAGKPSPLSPKRRKVADLYTQLLRQTIEGYQRLISSSIALNRFGWKKVVTTAVHRIFYYQSLMLCNYRLLYLPFARGVWQQIFWLYQLIGKYELLDSKVQSLTDDRQKTTLEYEFKKLLLITLLSPNLFKPNELHTVLQNMPAWLAHTSINDSRPMDIGHVYGFLPDTDMPPGLITPDSEQINPDVQMYYFDISLLVQYMQDKLADITDTDSSNVIKLGRNAQIDQRTMLLLLNNWGRPAVRDGERRAIAGHAELAIGLSAIHYLLGEGRTSIDPVFATAQAPSRNQDTRHIQFDTFTKSGNATLTTGFATERDEVRDVWDSAFFEPEPLPPAWTDSIRMKAYTYLPVRIVNASKGGFCISVPQEGVEQIQIGDLVALRGKTGQWQLGEIRWLLCPTNGPIRAGIKRLCSQVEQAHLHFTSKSQTSQPLRVLVGGVENGMSLYVPRMPTRLDDKSLALEYKGQRQPCRISALPNDTLLGFTYSLDLTGNKSAAGIPTGSNSSTDQYAQVWASL